MNITDCTSGGGLNIDAAADFLQLSL